MLRQDCFKKSGVDNPFSLIRPKISSMLDKSSPKVNLTSEDNRTTTVMQASDAIDGAVLESHNSNPAQRPYFTQPTIKFTVDDKGNLNSDIPSYWSTIRPGRISASG